MKLDYDPVVDALTLRLSAAPIEESDEVAPGIILDYDEDGQVIGIEVLDVSKRAGVAKSIETVLQPRMASVNTGREPASTAVAASVSASRDPGERHPAQGYAVDRTDTTQSLMTQEQAVTSDEQREPVSTGRL